MDDRADLNDSPFPRCMPDHWSEEGVLLVLCIQCHIKLTCWQLYISFHLYQMKNSNFCNSTLFKGCSHCLNHNNWRTSQWGHTQKVCVCRWTVSIYPPLPHLTKPSNRAVAYILYDTQIENVQHGMYTPVVYEEIEWRPQKN